MLSSGDYNQAFIFTIVMCGQKEKRERHVGYLSTGFDIFCYDSFHTPFQRLVTPFQVDLDELYSMV